MGETEGEGVIVGVLVTVKDGVILGVGVIEGLIVFEGVIEGVILGVAVMLGVLVGVIVLVGVNVGVMVGVIDGVAVMLGVIVLVGVFVGVGVGKINFCSVVQPNDILSTKTEDDGILSSNDTIKPFCNWVLVTLEAYKLKGPKAPDKKIL